jgi:hypothetical protein
MLVAALVVAGAMAATLLWFFRRLREVETRYGGGQP